MTKPAPRPVTLFPIRHGTPITEEDASHVRVEHCALNCQQSSVSACPPARRRCLAALCGQRCVAPFAKMLAADALMASAVAWDKLLPEATSPADVELVDFPLLLDDTDASSSDVDSALDAVLLPWDEAEEIDMEPAESEPWSHPAVKELPRRKGRRRDRVGKSKSKKLSAEAAPIRVRTYTARKVGTWWVGASDHGSMLTMLRLQNEIEQLNAELPQLEAYVDLLKQQAARTAGKQSSVDKLRLANSKLRDLAHRQQYPLIRVQSAMSRLVVRLGYGCLDCQAPSVLTVVC